MLMDLELTDEAFKLALKPFDIEFPDGLYSKVGNFIATPALASETLVEPTPEGSFEFGNYLKMFDNQQYHGEVSWSWHQVVLAVSLKKQLDKWSSPSTSKLSAENLKLVENVLDKLKKLLKKEGQTIIASELWSWKYEKGEI
jgi:hypothetical protein